MKRKRRVVFEDSVMEVVTPKPATLAAMVSAVKLGLYVAGVKKQWPLLPGYEMHLFRVAGSADFSDVVGHYIAPWILRFQKTSHTGMRPPNAMPTVEAWLHAAMDIRVMDNGGLTEEDGAKLLLACRKGAVKVVAPADQLGGFRIDRAFIDEVDLCG